jgi:hypothetical protein
MLDRWTATQLASAYADGAAIKVGNDSLHVGITLRETEPTIRMEHYVC